MQNSENIINLLLDDIIKKLEHIPAFEDKNKLDTFKANLYLDFLETIAKSVAESLLISGNANNEHVILHELLDSGNLQDFFSKLGLIIAGNDMLASNFKNNLLIIYTDFCTKFRISVNFELFK
jgi:hypothetical protein